MNSDDWSSVFCASIDGRIGDRIELEVGLPVYIDQERTIRSWQTTAELNLSSTIPEINQRVQSGLHGLPDLKNLRQLVSGDNSSPFVFETECFKIQMLEIHQGVRSSIATIFESTTIRYAEYSPWPKSERFAEHLLLNNSEIGNVRAAFLVDYEQVVSFLKKLEVLYQQVDITPIE